MGIHNPNAIAQMVINPAETGYHLGPDEPCPHDPANRYRMVITLRGRLCEQHRQRWAVHAALKALDIPAASLHVQDTGRTAMIVLSGDDYGIIAAKLAL